MILKTVRQQLRAGIPCVFVHKDARLSVPSTLLSMGYELIGEAMVPPQNFVLPDSRKKANKDSTDRWQGANGIVSKRQRITVARTV